MREANPKIPYGCEALFAPGKPRVYRGRELDNIAFPLGGIGTGAISIGGWGQLRDFEIFNRPQKGLIFKETFFTLHARKRGGASVTRVIQGPVGGCNFTDAGSGVPRDDGAGLPHFKSVEFEGAFPFARLRFDDPKMPLQVSLEAYNPFIPLNPDDSGLPVAMFNFHLKNVRRETIEAVLYATLENRTGFPQHGNGSIEYFETPAVRGLLMSTRKHARTSARYGTLALVTPHRKVMMQTHGYPGSWRDSSHRFWDQASEGALQETREKAIHTRRTDIGTIALKVKLASGQSARLPVWIIWHNPNFEKYWDAADRKPVWKNYYATRFKDARCVAEYVGANHARLEAETRAFADALWSSTLPAPVLDAVSSQISILKSTTCIRLTDGTFYGFEGCNPAAGCCEGTCTHVWNYAQALPYLFPSLERSIRDAEYSCGLHNDGYMNFRLPLPLGTVGDDSFHAAADGQMGSILRVYREWIISGDDAWLRRLWPRVKKALEYAWKYWDRDQDGVMEGVQHNTYDVEFYGPNTMMGSLYLGALRAAEEMAKHLGETPKAQEYRAVFESGRAKTDARLFNGEYFVQDVRLAARRQASHPSAKIALDPKFANYPKYQYGKGCLSDQMIGQWYARMLQLGDLFDPEHVRAAMASIFKYNWRRDLSEHANPQRIYAVNDEAGLLVASWPKGGRPALPLPYSDEVWTGIEYQVASHLMYEGLVEEGLAIVKAVRDRHNGARRNPWNEFECGNHYARAMSSYGLLLALSGFHYSAPEQSLWFAPRVNQQRFACFFSVNSGWGIVRQRLRAASKRLTVEVHRGALALREVHPGFLVGKPRVALGARVVPATAAYPDEGALIRLSKPVVLRTGQSLIIDSRH